MAERGRLSAFKLMFALLIVITATNLRIVAGLEGNLSNIVQKALIIVLGATFILTHRVHRLNLVLLGAIVFVLVFCALGSEYEGFQAMRFIGGVTSIVAVFILLMAEPRPDEGNFVLKTLAALPIIYAAAGAAYAALGIMPLFHRDTLGSMRLAGSYAPAYMGAAAYAGCFAAMQLTERRHFAYAAVFVVNLALLILSGARMALALTFMICGVMFLLGFRRFPILKLFLPIYVVGALAGFVVLFGGDTIQRFQSASMMGRDLLWGVMETYLDAHPWFGVGIGNQQLLISDRISLLTGGTIAAHNEYFRIAVELGYPGSVVFFLLTLWILFNVWISPWVQRDPVFLVTALSFLIYCMTDNAFGAPEIFLILTGASFGATLKRSTASSSVGHEPLPPGRRTPIGTLPAARP